MITLIVLHFVADFLLQSREMGKRKSSDYKYLFAHLFIQFIIFLPFIGVQLSLLNAAIHGIIDKNIWNLYKLFVVWNYNLDSESGKSFKYWEDHWFFTTIGLDQSLHMITLVYINSLLGG
jgi:uncharacterized membrane protein